MTKPNLTLVKAPAVIHNRKLNLFWEEVLQVSHSRIKMWRRCQMAHHYRYYQRLRKLKPPTALFIGTGVHAMLEAQIVKGTYQPELEQFTKDFNKLFREEREILGDVPAELESVVAGYFKRYQDSDLVYVPRHRGKQAEIQVRVDLDNRTRFIGFIDRFPQDAEGRNWVMDHKTCRSIPDEETRFADLQLLMYVWLLPQLGYPTPDGVIWDYLRKKAPAVPELLVKGGLSKAQKIDTTYDVYMATVDKLLGPEKRPEYEEFAQTLRGREEKFYRRIYLPSPNQAMVESVVGDVMASVEEIRRSGPTATVRNMTRDCKQCSYYSLCQAEVRGLDSEYIRKAEYIVKEKTDGREEKVEQQTGDE